MKVELNAREIFDCEKTFDLVMLHAFTAQNDINRINVLLQNAETLNEKIFLFKIMIGILRESLMLIKEIYDEHLEEIRKFDNHNEILLDIDNLSKMNHGMDKNSFSCKVLTEVRNQTFHYKEADKIKEALCSLTDSDLSFEVGDTVAEIEYTFADELWFEFVNKKCYEFFGEKDLKGFVEKITPYSICVFEVLKKMTTGFLEKYTVYSSNSDGTIKLKRLIF